MDIIDSFAIVVIVVDDGHVRDSRVADVDVAPISRTCVIPRNVWLTVSQGEPADTAADSERDTPVRSADPRNEGRSVNGTSIDRSWAPTPISANVGPAAIVERGITPGRVIDPSPTPRGDPDPVAKTIGSPSGSNNGRNPNRAIAWIATPRAVGVEIFVADYAGRDVAGRQRAVLTLVTNGTPVVEPGPSGSGIDRVSHRLSIGKAALLTGLDLHRGSVAGGDAFTVPNRDQGDVIVGIDVQAIVAALGDGECGVRGVDLIDLTRQEIAHVQIQRALIELNLHGVVADVAEGDASLGVHAERAGSDLNLSA